MMGTSEYIVCSVFFVGAIVCIVIALLMKTPTERRRLANALEVTADLEAQRAQRQGPRPHRPRLDIQALDNIAAATTYKDLIKSQESSLPKDQTGESVECVICLEDFESNSSVRCLPCHHIFHSECITKWLVKRHAVCPLCQAKFVPDSVLPTEPPRVQPYPAFHAALIAAGAEQERRQLEVQRAVPVLVPLPRRRESV